MELHPNLDGGEAIPQWIKYLFAMSLTITIILATASAFFVFRGESPPPASPTDAKREEEEAVKVAATDLARRVAERTASHHAQLQQVGFINFKNVFKYSSLTDWIRSSF